MSQALGETHEVIVMGRPYKCPYCGKSESVAKGRRRTKTMGDRCIRRCKACRRKFTPRNQKPSELGVSAEDSPQGPPDSSAAGVPAAVAPGPLGQDNHVVPVAGSVNPGSPSTNEPHV
jgi:hypothetical protein